MLRFSIREISTKRNGFHYLNIDSLNSYARLLLIRICQKHILSQEVCLVNRRSQKFQSAFKPIAEAAPVIKPLRVGSRTAKHDGLPHGMIIFSLVVLVCHFFRPYHFQQEDLIARRTCRSRVWLVLVLFFILLICQSISHHALPASPGPFALYSGDLDFAFRPRWPYKITSG